MTLGIMNLLYSMFKIEVGYFEGSKPAHVKKKHYMILSETPMMSNEEHNHYLNGMTPAELAELAEHIRDTDPEFGDADFGALLVLQESEFNFIQNNRPDRDATNDLGQTSSRSLLLVHDGDSSHGTRMESQLALDEEFARALELGDDFNSLCSSESGGSAVDNILPASRETPALDENQNIRQDDIDPDRMTHEELLSLTESVGTETKGLPADLIARLPTFKYKAGLFSRKKKKEKEECVICLAEYKNRSELITLPCAHQYHSKCITHWLQISKYCPVCQKEVQDE